MSTFRPQQRRLTIGERTFHFVAYEAQPANPRKGERGSPAMWYLMVEGHRCPALPYHPDQSEDEVDHGLLRWVRAHAVSDEPDERPSRKPHRTRTLWWGPD